MMARKYFIEFFFSGLYCGLQEIEEDFELKKPKFSIRAQKELLDLKGKTKVKLILSSCIPLSRNALEGMVLKYWPNIENLKIQEKGD